MVVTRPDVLVCDEPTTLLDLRNTREVAALLESLSQRVILVTHDLELVEGWSRVLVMNDGSVVADGPASEVLPFYRRLMS